ncbi:MAG: RIP metalloprotease RseP [Gemmatimonadaceae bacterium]
MLDALKSVAGPLFVFGIVVFVHELGHFLAAKLVGVYAPRFSIGFGPALWRRRRGETEYIIAALPLGGYVRMASRDDEATAFLEGGGEEKSAASSGAEPGRPTSGERDWDPEAMQPFGPQPIPEDRWFESKPLPARLFIMLAGVTMNVVLAIVVMIGVLAFYGERIIPTRVVGAVNAPVAAPQLAERILPGDTVLAVDGSPVSSWTAFDEAIVRGAGSTVSIATSRDTVDIHVGSASGLAREELATALVPHMPPVIGRVAPGSPASAAGIVDGDSVVAVGGMRVASWSEMVGVIERSPGERLSVSVVRRDSVRELTLRPESATVVDPMTGEEKIVGRIGVLVTVGFTERAPMEFGEAAAEGWRQSWAMSGAIIALLQDLFTGAASVTNLGGPILIATVSAEAARSGLETLLRLLALLSINIAIFNLLPIPVLDGGQIIINLVEAAKGSAFSRRSRELILRGGLFVIALIFVLIMWNDIARVLRSLG